MSLIKKRNFMSDPELPETKPNKAKSRRTLTKSQPTQFFFFADQNQTDCQKTNMNPNKTEENKHSKEKGNSNQSQFKKETEISLGNKEEIQNDIESIKLFDFASFQITFEQVAKIEKINNFTSERESKNKRNCQTLEEKKPEIQTQIEQKTETMIPWFITLDEDENNSFQPPKLLPFPSLDKKGKFTLCLDLDQTLISSSFAENKNYDFSFEFKHQGKNWKVFVTKRPHLDEFLLKCSQMFEVVVFTASLKDYANSILDRLDPEKKMISHRLYQESCSNFPEGYLKDLSILGREMDKIIIVDDTPFSYSRNQRNAIPVKPFHPTKRNNSRFNFENWKKDCELPRILEILQIIQKNKQLFKTLDKVKKRKQQKQRLEKL
ncbi:nuclear lim interactor-interacting factor-related [Anaeramoeba flamelloides]|uniref:Nuclear lim interactor-interacting factor-related n=1 Tax=Anaeramoeba flamelloides TaxID=1746091 RepID=A0AAV7ZJT0_9EUKA|nr:nuclear lim interactor-interacting factor-related [Anaeramoeba flamelloides]